MCDAPSVVLKPMPYVMGVQQVDEVGMRAVDDKVKAKRFHEDLLGVEYLVRNFINFWSTFGYVTDIYSLCLGLAYPSYVPELPSALFCLGSEKDAGGRDGLSVKIEHGIPHKETMEPRSGGEESR